MLRLTTSVTARRFFLEQGYDVINVDTRRPAHVPAKFWDATKGEILR